MSKKTQKIHGIVSREAISEKEHCSYQIRAGGREYEVLSSGLQAVKDVLFIRRGQHMEIEVNATTNETAPYQLFPQKTKIQINIPHQKGNSTYEN